MDLLTPNTEKEYDLPNAQIFDVPLFRKERESFLLEGKYRNLQPTTLQFYREHLSEFQQFLSRVNVVLTPLSYAQLMFQMIGSMQERELSTHTIQGRIRTCRRLFRFMYPELHWPKLAIPLEKDTHPTSSIFCFTKDQVDALLKTPNQNTFKGLRDYTMMLVLLDTGIRGFELSALKLSDIDWDEQTLRISVGKGQRIRYVPFQQTCRESLLSYIAIRGRIISIPYLWVTLRSTPFKHSAVLNMLQRHCRKIRRKGVRGSAHTFRHTMAKSFLLHGGSVFALQHILGHSTLEMTRRYVSLLDADLRLLHAKHSPMEYLVSSAQYAEKEVHSPWK